MVWRLQVPVTDLDPTKYLGNSGRSIEVADIEALLWSDSVLNERVR